MELYSYKLYAYFEKSGPPNKTIVPAVLTNSSGKKRLFWLIFEWNDDPKKIMGILQNHWKISPNKATLISNEILLLKKNPTPAVIMTEHSFVISKLCFDIMYDGTNDRLVLSTPVNKKNHECKPRDKRWIYVTKKLDPNKYSRPTKDDLLNTLGCSDPKDRIELIKQINLFFDNHNIP